MKNPFPPSEQGIRTALAALLCLALFGCENKTTKAVSGDTALGSQVLTETCTNGFITVYKKSGITTTTSRQLSQGETVTLRGRRNGTSGQIHGTGCPAGQIDFQCSAVTQFNNPNYVFSCTGDGRANFSAVNVNTTPNYNFSPLPSLPFPHHNTTSTTHHTSYVSSATIGGGTVRVMGADRKVFVNLGFQVGRLPCRITFDCP